MRKYSKDFLLGEKVKIYQPTDGYRASSDAVFLSSLIGYVKEGDCILDVGSGTGAVSLCLAYRFPHTSIVGIEIQADLVNLANKSVKANGFENLSYIEADISAKNVPLKADSFTHVVTNPPFFENEHPSPNKSKSIAHHLKGFSLEQWLHFCLKMLKSNGWLYLIEAPQNLSDVLGALKGKAGNIRLVALFSKSGQNAKRILICAQKSSKAPLEILPTFRVHAQNGAFTTSAQSILRNGKSFF